MLKIQKIIVSNIFPFTGPQEDFFDELNQEKSQLESYIVSGIVSNEKQINSMHGTGRDGDKTESKIAKKSQHLKVLNYFYDITPSSLISLVITEKGLLPCSSVSAVIRKNYGRF